MNSPSALQPHSAAAPAAPSPSVAGTIDGLQRDAVGLMFQKNSALAQRDRRDGISDLSPRVVPPRPPPTTSLVT